MNRLTAIAVLLVGCSCLLALGPARADAQRTESKRVTVRDYLAYQQEVREKVDSGRYGHFSRVEIARIERAQSTIASLLADVATIEDLSDVQKISLLNATEEVSAVLSLKEQDKVFCRHERITGSRLKKTLCKTREQRDQEADAGHYALERAAVGRVFLPEK